MDLSNRFFELFAGLKRAYGVYQIKFVNEKGKSEGHAQTATAEYTAQQWKFHLAGETGLGVIPIQDGNHCRWGAIDIDTYGIDLIALSKTLETLKLPLVLCRSKSGGAHLYAFFKEDVDAQIVKKKLTEFSIALGYPKVEIFPKQATLANKRDVGNWINMPYFAVKNTTRYAIINGDAVSAKEFLDAAFARQLTLQELIDTAPPLPADFMDWPPCLQHLARNGVHDGHRNNSLYSIGVYLKMKFPDEWEMQLDTMNARYVIPPMPSKEVQQLAKSLKRKDYFYKCMEHPLADSCNKDVCKGRKYGVGKAGQEISVLIGGLSKYMTEMPTWILNVDGHNIELSTKQLMSQAEFRLACVEKLNKLPGRVKDSVWETMIAEKLAAVEIVDAPDDAGPSGIFKHHLIQYVTQYGLGKAQEDLLKGKVWHDENSKLWFHGPTFIEYLKRMKFYAFNEAEIYMQLRQYNVGKKFLHIKGKGRNYWFINAFETQTEDYAVPDIKIEGEF